MINENILGKCFRSSASSAGPGISLLTAEYEYPQLLLLIIAAAPNQRNCGRRTVSRYSMLTYSEASSDLLWTLYFSHSNRRAASPRQLNARVRRARVWGGRHGPRLSASGPTRARRRDPTTSFLTAATQVYAIGAGITAAAGTRLALQLILAEDCKFHSFHLPD